MTIKPMSEEDTIAPHKRTASSTSAVAPGSSPPHKRPMPSSSASSTAPPPVRRDFPLAVALVLYKDGADEASSTTVLGAYAALADANEEVRRLALEQGGAQVDEAAAAKSSEPVRWDAPDGVSCWVELHAVTPRRIVPRSASSGTAAEPPKKLYDAEEGEDPDLDDDDHDDGVHYD